MTLHPIKLAQFQARLKKRGYFVRDGRIHWQGMYAGLPREWDISQPNSTIQRKLLLQFYSLLEGNVTNE